MAMNNQSNGIHKTSSTIRSQTMMRAEEKFHPSPSHTTIDSFSLSLSSFDATCHTKGSNMELATEIAKNPSISTSFAGDDGEVRKEDPKIRQTTEDVLAIPRIWTKRAYQLLVEHKAVPRPWHLEGRWGSRTHQVDEKRMGFPIVSGQTLQELATLQPTVKELLQVEGVAVLTNHPFVASRRARDPVYFDATIHPERQRYSFSRPTNEGKQHGPFPAKRMPGEPALFTYAELFAGIGGFGVALDALGGKCIFVSELEEHCRETYMANFDTAADCIHGDIYAVDDSQLPEPGTLDLLVGGFPCQPFSNMSDQPGFACEKGRGVLFQEIVRVLKVSRPKSFLLENVPGLHDMKDTYQHIIGAFEEAGYQVFSEVCSARGLTATSRKRLFFAGFRNDLVDGAPISFEFPFVPDLQLKGEDILDYDELPADELEILRLKDETMDRLLNSGRWRPHSLAWPNRPCDTLTSHYGNAVGRGESQLVPCSAPHHPRRFSVRECARLMGFPNTYRLVPPKAYQGDMAYRKLYYRMFGNAVCPPIVAVLAGAILDYCQIEDVSERRVDWTEHGLHTGVGLAFAVTRERVIHLPLGCMVASGIQ